MVKKWKQQIAFRITGILSYWNSGQILTNIKNLYKKVATDASYASADHKIMVYRFQDEQGKLHEGYDDGNEYGCGRRLLKIERQ